MAKRKPRPASKPLSVHEIQKLVRETRLRAEASRDKCVCGERLLTQEDEEKHRLCGVPRTRGADKREQRRPKDSLPSLENGVRCLEDGGS